MKTYNFRTGVFSIHTSHLQFNSTFLYVTSDYVHPSLCHFQYSLILCEINFQAYICVARRLRTYIILACIFCLFQDTIFFVCILFFLFCRLTILHSIFETFFPNLFALSSLVHRFLYKVCA